MRLLAVALAVLACVGASAEEEWRELDWKPAVEGGREATVRDFHLVERDSPGNCGEHDFTVSRASDGPELAYCARALHYRMRGRIPDLLISGVRVGSDIGGPSGWVFEDVLLRYEAGTWTETVIMAVDYQAGKPKN